MPRCIDCARFPWAKGTDLSMLPAVKCHPDIPARRFTEDGARQEWECRYFAPNDGVIVEKSEAEVQASEAVIQTPTAELSDAQSARPRRGRRA